MSRELETLGRRAVACNGWRWLAGMKVVHAAAHEGATGYTARLPQDGYRPVGGELPDLSDPATLGCLVALVRWASGKPWLFCTYRQEGYWSVCDLHEHLSGFVKSEAEAWVETLEGLNVG